MGRVSLIGCELERVSCGGSYGLFVVGGMRVFLSGLLREWVFSVFNF